MLNYIELMFASFIALISTFFMTFLVKKVAIKFHIVDLPNARKIHQVATPLLGGLAIFFGVFLGMLFLRPEHEHLFAIIAGAIVIIITGVLDDRYNIRPMIKLAGQTIAAIILISSGLIVEKVTLPFLGTIDLGFFSVIITIVWIVGITNAINLIDGLDGLATGVSSIALLTMFTMALIDMQLFAAYLSLIIVSANLGFLYHNFYPAKIYMGDTGSNFLGFMIAVISIVGLFKNIAILSFVIPIIVLAVPIFETLFSIVRRLIRQEPIMQPDNKHIHYQLIRVGLTHRQSVLIMYGFSFLFGVLAVLFSKVPPLMTFAVTMLILILIHFLAEIAGLVMGGKRPVIQFFMKLFRIKRRNQKEQDESSGNK